MWNGIVRHKIRIHIPVKSEMNIHIFHEMRGISLVERTNSRLSRRPLFPWKQLVTLLSVRGVAGGTGDEWCGRTGRQNPRGGKMSTLSSTH